MLRGVHLVRLDDTLLDAAGLLDPAVVRSLGAVHLAAAQQVAASLTALVTYDRRMAEAAKTLGFVVLEPA